MRFVPSRSVQLLVLELAVIACFLFLNAGQSVSQTMSSLPTDPANGGVGFARAHWATSINKMLVFMVPGKDNSVRALDPVTRSWEYLWPNSLGANGPQARDNFASFYVPRLDELWLWGGSYLEQYGSRALRSGRFHVGQKRWVATGTADGDAFSAIIDLSAVGGAMPWHGADPATAWNAQLDMGMVCCGASNAYSGDFYLIEPNPSGAKPYKATKLTGNLPPARAQAMNIMVAAGTDFYVFSGYTGTDANRNYTYTNDFWKFDGLTRVWSRLPNPPAVSYQPTVTYDSDKNAVVAWINDRIYAYDIAAGQWSDHTPAGLPCLGNQVGVYSPTAKLHIFEGGNPCVDGTPFNGAQVFAVNLSGSRGAPVLSSSTSSSSGSSTNPQSSGGTAPAASAVGAFDAISSDGTASGWSYDPNFSSDSNQVQIFVDGPIGTGSLIGAATANLPRADINSKFGVSGNHGFLFSIPAHLRDGKQHQLYVYGIDKTGRSNFLLAGSPKSFTLGTSGSTSTTPSASTAPQTANLATTPAVSGALNIPLRTWVARRFNTLNAPAAGLGAGGNGSKHLRFAQDLTTGHIYELGGDYSVFVEPGNSWYGLWKYDVVNDKWTQPYPWCGYPGEVMLGARDELGWVYDSRRKIFWALPGFVYPTGNFSCNNGVKEVYGAMMTFDPATNKWSNPNAAPEPISGEKPKNAIYDPVTDSIYRSGIGPTGLGWSVYHIPSNKWTWYETSHATDGTYINSTSLGHEYIAADIAGRKIYAIDPIDYRLFQFDMDRYTVTIKAPIPEPNPARVALSRNRVWALKNFTMPVFDTVNNVLLYPYINALDDARPVLLIYHPSTDRWETDPMYQPDGLAVRGNSFVFDAINNVLISLGGASPGGDADPTLTHFFLYRYGNGDGKPYSPPTLPPSVAVTPPPPTAIVPTQPASTLTAANLGVTGEDKVGQINETKPNGKADFHISMAGLRGTPSKVTITSDTGGIWETPFNGVNWIIATQYDGQGNGHLWFEQFGSKTFRVKVRYADGTLDEADATNLTSTSPTAVQPPPASTSTLKALDLGVTGEDKVGRNQTSPNGRADFHLTASGLRGTPAKVRITSNTGGIWETPFNGQNWIIAAQYDGQGNGHFWFEPFASNSFRIQVWYADGTTAAADAVNQSSSVNPPSDTTAPQVAIASPVANAQVSKTTTVTIAAVDNIGISRVELYKDGSLVGTGSSGNYQYAWDTTQESNGFHTLIAVAYDAANNRSTATLTVNVQNTSSVGTKPSVLGKRF